MCDLDSVAEFPMPQRHWEDYSLEDLIGAVMREEIDKTVARRILSLDLGNTN